HAGRAGHRLGRRRGRPDPGGRMTRPKARMKLGKHLIGSPPWRSLPHGVVVYGEYDRADRTTYYWEEWELLGYENTDFWVEYDHYTRKVTLYRPVEVPQ